MELSKGTVILLSSISAFVIMFVVLYVQWRIEREANGAKLMFFLHVFNVLTMMMFYGTTYLSLLLATGTFSKYGSYIELLFLQATVYPFPFILFTYLIFAALYHRFIRPVRKVKGTNIVVMRRKWDK